MSPGNWTLGEDRRTMEANRATAQASKADLENARLSAQAQLARIISIVFFGYPKKDPG